MHAHTKFCLGRKGRYWVYILFCLVRNIFDIKVFIVISSKLQYTSYRTRLMEHEFFWNTKSIHILGSFTLLISHKEWKGYKLMCDNIVSCWVKHNGLITEFAPIYIISTFILDLHNYFWPIIPKMFVITVYKLHIFIEDFMF